MARQIEVWYSLPQMDDTIYTGSTRFTDWYDFADWLKQATLTGRPVTITEWQYVEPNLTQGP